jgi:hypothetical protein
MLCSETAHRAILLSEARQRAFDLGNVGSDRLCTMPTGPQPVLMAKSSESSGPLSVIQAVIDPGYLEASCSVIGPK